MFKPSLKWYEYYFIDNKTISHTNFISTDLGTRRQRMKDKANALKEKKEKYLEEHMNVTISKGTVYILKQ